MPNFDQHICIANQTLLKRTYMLHVRNAQMSPINALLISLNLLIAEKNVNLMSKS